MKNNFTCKLKNIAQGFPSWAQMVIRSLFVFLFLYEGYRSWEEARKKKKSPPCQSVSIIIPTLNEEKNIVKCIRSVSVNRHVQEIIVTDAGSSDQTRISALQAGACLMIHDQPVENGGGRGGQIKEGLASAKGDVVVVLHADTILPSPEIDRIMATLNHHPTVIGGSVGSRFDSPQFRFRIIELANDFRAAFLKISFGDQVQFFRREPVIASDLFPKIPLMEDVEFSVRLRRLGRQLHLFGNALVSARRWEKIGIRNALWVFIRTIAYLVCRPWSEPDTVKLYQKYYQNDRFRPNR